MIAQSDDLPHDPHRAAPGRNLPDPAASADAGAATFPAAPVPRDLSGYHELIAAKHVAFEARGLKHIPALNPLLKPHQAHCTEFALRCGSAAHFLSTGLGKTFCAQEWARVLVEHTNKPVLMLAPLGVTRQHETEGARFGLDVKAVREPSEITGARIYVTNYDRLAKFDASRFAGVILDESSIIKNFTGATTRKLISAFADTPFRLACTATPAPNDHMELGQHSQFLGVMASNEMLSRWFIADQTNMGKYKIKAPAVRPFWNWVASWARCIDKPSDVGFSDEGYDLPPLNVHRHVIEVDITEGAGADRNGQLGFFRNIDTSATSIHREKRLTASMRADKIAEIVAAEPGESWVVWCDTDYEADELTARIPGAVEVRGSMKPDEKENRIASFAPGGARVLISKPSVCGWGLNWQHCARVAFVGLSFSYEAYHQAVRRCWRFGQARPVDVHIACAQTEANIWEIVSRKAGDHDRMKREMTAAMARAAASSKILHLYRPEVRAALPSFLGG